METFIENTFAKLINASDGTLQITESDSGLVYITGDHTGHKIKLSISLRIPNALKVLCESQDIEKNCTLFCYVNGAMAYGNQLAPVSYVGEQLVILKGVIKNGGMSREAAFDFINS